MLADFEAKQTNVKSSLLHISGAIKVLEEELEKYYHNNGGKPEQQPDETPAKIGSVRKLK